ncbi:MAG: PilZ domain-containing protein [bacterium]
MKSKKITKERRQHRRTPMSTPMLKMVSLDVPALHLGESLPGIMGNLSAGGMTIATFAEIPVGTELSLSLDLPGMSPNNIKGRVVRVDNKQGSCLISINFVSIDAKTKKQINDIVHK